MSNFTRTRLLGAITCSLLGAAGALAQPSAIQELDPARPPDATDRESTRLASHRDIQVGYETRDSNQLDVSRFSVVSNWAWEMENRSHVTLRAPYQNLRTESAGQTAKVDGLQDFQLTYFSQLPEDDRDTQGRWEIWANLPFGDDALDTGETLAVQRARASADSFFAPQPTNGFGAGLGYHWMLRRGNYRDDFSIRARAYQSYDLSKTIGATTVQGERENYQLEWSRTKTQEKVERQFGLRLILLSSSLTERNGTGTKIDSSSNLHFWYRATRELNTKSSLSYQVRYQSRDTQDSFNLGVVAPSSTDLGDRVLYSVLLNRQMSEAATVSVGFQGLWTDETSVAGVARAGTRRDENYATVGYTRRRDNGRGWSVNADVGVSSDAQDARLTARWFMDI